MHPTAPWLLGALTLAAATAVLAQQAPPSGIERLAPRPLNGPAPDPTMVRGGEATYTQVCAACHGVQGRGGPNNAPDLTMSAIAMAADGGRELHQFLQVGRPERGMPPYPVGEAEAADLSAKLRSLAFAVGPPASAAGSAAAGAANEPVLVGDAKAGKTFFNGTAGGCANCHAVSEGQPSSASNLSKIAAKYPDPRVLQNNMVLNRGVYWTPAYSKDVTAIVSYRDGRSLTGYLSSVSDFKVIIRSEANEETTVVRKDGEPKVVLKDRLQHHLDLLPKYRDSDMHDVTAYLATLK